MRDLALDPTTGDLLIENFDLGIVWSIDQIAQNLAIRLRFYFGEWYLNTFAGVPYYQYFFIKNPNQIQVETFLKEEISNTEGVLEITSFNSNFDGKSRRFTVDFGCRTISGNMLLNLELP